MTESFTVQKISYAEVALTEESQMDHHTVEMFIVVKLISIPDVSVILETDVSLAHVVI